MFRLTVDIYKTRLDKFLAEQLPQISRARIQRDIAAGLAAVNHQTIIEPKHIVRAGEVVEYNFKKTSVKKISAKSLPIKLLYNNHGLLILDKPAGLSVHPGAGVKGDSLAEALLYHFKDIKGVGEASRPGIVHRLDKDTSGVMLVARTPEMYEYLKDAFAERKIKKEYIALVLGKMEKPHGFIETPIGKSKSDFRKHTTKDMLQPKDALTEYQVLEFFKLSGRRAASAGDLSFSKKASSALSLPLNSTLDYYTLVRVKLHTGRTHQIRVHFYSLGHPLAGDKLYGDKLYGGKRAELPDLSRQFLHAASIEVKLPNGAWIEAESPLADDLRQVLKNLNSKIVDKL